MAILVTGAAGLVGRAAVAALLRQDVEHVRAVVRNPRVAGLRRLGPRRAATDPDGLAAAMDGVFTACSLTGSLWSPLARTRTRPWGRPRCSWPPPAPPGSAGWWSAPRPPSGRPPDNPPANPHLAAKAEVERMVAASGLEHAILRCTHVLGPDSRLLDLLAGRPPGQGPGRRPPGSPPSGSATWPRPSPPPTTPWSWPPPGRCPARTRSASTPWSTPSTAGRWPSTPRGRGRADPCPGRGPGRRLACRPGAGPATRPGPDPAGRDPGRHRQQPAAGNRGRRRLPGGTAGG